MATSLFITCPYTQGAPDFDPSKYFVRTKWKICLESILVVGPVTSFYPSIKGPVVPIVLMIADLSSDRLTPEAYMGYSPCHGVER